MLNAVKSLLFLYLKQNNFIFLFLKQQKSYICFSNHSNLSHSHSKQSFESIFIENHFNLE